MDYFPKMQDCNAVDELSKSLLFKFVLIIKIGFCLLGLLLICYEFFVKRSRQKISLHENATIICNFIRFFLAWICVGYICTHTYDFIRLSKSVESPCDRLATSFSVILLRMNTTVATNAQVAALFILAFERFLCTKFLVRYENSAKPCLILIALVALTLICTIAAYLALFSSLNSQTLLVFSQARSESTVLGFTIYSYSLLGGELIVGFLFLGIRLWNSYLFQRVRCKKLSLKEQRNLLSMKFQINETLEIMDTFLPIVFGQFCLYIFTIIGGMIIPVIFSESRPPILASLNEAVFVHLLSAHVFAIVRLHKIHQFSFFPCFSKPSAPRNTAIKIEQMETNEDFYQHQKAMFDAPQINFARN